MTNYPVPATFPAPTGIFPPSAATTDPAYGVNPYLQSAFSSNTSAILQARSLRQGQLMQAAQFASVNQQVGGVLDSDPRTWTPDQAAEQTDRALAKLSTVNPDLAEQLASQRTGEAPDGGGFFDGLKDLVGEVVGAGLAVGGKLFDIISRPAHIIPNIVFDVVDGGEFDLSEDVGGALTGNLNHNWNSVFQKMGWEGGGVSGFVRAAFGLIGDVATDPLTYLIPVATAKFAQKVGTVAREAVPKVLTDKLASMSPAQLAEAGLDDAAEWLGRATPDEMATKLREMYDAAAGNLHDAGLMGSVDAAERLAAATNQVFTAGEKAVFGKYWEITKKLTQLQGGRGLRSAMRSGLFLDDGMKLGVKETKTALERIIKEKMSIARGPRGTKEAKALADAAWAQARTMASAIGGTRLKFAVPYTPFRYLSSPIWSMARFTPLSMGGQVANFFAGHSAVNNIVHAIQADGAPWAMLTHYMERGWRGTKDLPGIFDMPEYAPFIKSMRGRGRNLGSSLYTASEKMGGITAAFDKGARASRVGLTGVWTYNEALAASRLKNDLIAKVVNATDKNAHRDLETHHGISTRTSKNTATAEHAWGVQKVMDHFPAGLDMDDPRAIEAWYRRTHADFELLDAQAGAHAGGDATQVLDRLRAGTSFAPLDEEAAAKLARHKAILADAQESALGYRDAKGELVPWTAKQKEVLESFRKRFSFAADEAATHEAAVGRQNLLFREATGIHPAQVDLWRSQSGVQDILIQQEPHWYVTPKDAQALQEMKNRGVNDGLIDHGDDALGVHIHTDQRPGDIEVTPRGQELVRLDEAGNTQMMGGLEGGTADRTLLDVRQRVDEAVRQAKEVGELAAPSQEDIRRNTVELTTEAIKADRPHAVGTVRKGEHGGWDAVIFDPENLKQVGDFAIVEESLGHLPRILSNTYRTWINGIVPKTRTQILLREPFIQAELARKTAGMTLQESEDYVRELLIKTFNTTDPADLFKAHAWESNLAHVDNTYLQNLAKDVAAQHMGRFAERMVRQGKLAPFMFGSVPRGQEYELQVSRGLVRALEGKDAKLRDVVMRLKKAESKYLDAAHASHARGIEGVAEFAALIESDLAAYQLAPKELQAVLKYGSLAAEAEDRIEAELGSIAKRRAELATERAGYDAAQDEFLQAQTKAQAAKAEVDAADAAAKAADEAAKAAPKSVPIEDLKKAERDLIQQRDAAVGQSEAAINRMNIANENNLETLKPGIKKEQAAVKKRLKKIDDLLRKNREAQDAAADEADVQNLEALLRGAPPVAEGHVRLYRAQVPGDAGMTPGQGVGQYWTTHPELALGYQRIDPANRTFHYVDVPQAFLDKYRAGLDEEAGIVYDEIGEVILPKNLAQGSKELAPKPVVYTHEVTLEPFEYVDEKRQLLEAADDELFKDSVVKGEVFHGTVVPFEGNPRIDKTRRGLMFSDNETFSSDLGAAAGRHGEGAQPRVLHGRLDIRNPMDLRSGAAPEGFADEMLKYERGLPQGPWREQVAAANRTLESTGDVELWYRSFDDTHRLHNEVLAPQGYDGVVFQEELVVGKSAGEASAGNVWIPFKDEQFVSTSVAGHRPSAQAFEALVEDGKVHVRTDPVTKAKSIFKEDGSLVNPNGGRTLKPQYTRDLEFAALNEQEAELNKALESLRTGNPYDAPAEAQVGARLPGEHRTPEQAATFAAQRAGKGLGTVAQKHRVSAKEAAQVGRVLGGMRQRLTDISNSVNRAYAEAKGAAAAVKPALVQIETAGDLGGLTALRVPGFEGFAMPAYMADELHNVIDIHGVEGVRKHWREWVLGPWKRWATYRWPGFHVRNAYGAWFNNFLGGVTIHDYGFAWRVNNYGKKTWTDRKVEEAEWIRYSLGQHFGEDMRGKLTYGQVKEHLSGINVGSANTRAALESANTSDIAQNAIDAMARGDRARFGRLAHGYEEGAKRAGSAVEDFHRVAAWSRGMTHTSGDTWGARQFVMMRHGDYAELTPLEDGIRDLVPFYKWMRTNIPYQFRMLAENPAGLALVSKVRQTAYDIAGVDQTQAELGQPDFMKQSLSIPLPDWVPFIGSKGPDGIKYLMADLPYNDLYNGLNDYISAVLPVGRNLIESYGFHQQAFTGKPLDNSMVKLSGAFGATWVGKLLSMVPATGVKEGADGSYYINDRLENVLTAWPIYSRFRNFIEADEARVEQRLGGTLSMVFGVGVRTADATQAELDFYYNEVEPLLDQYRDMGVTFPNAQDFIQGANAVAPIVPTFAVAS